MRQLHWMLVGAAVLSFAAESNVAAGGLGTPTSFTVTAYCQSGHTRSGVRTTRGIAAGDPEYLPIGSIVHVEAPNQDDSGVYTIMDTGSKIIGRHIDLFQAD